jgi:hypothetical protein
MLLLCAFSYYSQFSHIPCSITTFWAIGQGGYGGNASGRKRVNEFMRILEEEFGIACTPRVKRGLLIDAGCGQLKSKELLKDEEKQNDNPQQDTIATTPATSEEFSMDSTTVDLDSDELYSDDGDDEDGEIMDETFDPAEASRLLSLVQGTTIKEASDDIDEKVRP